MVPQIRESAYHVSNYDYDWLLGALGPEKQHFQQKEFYPQEDFYPPSYILVGRRKVTFDDQEDIFEVEKIDPCHHGSCWFTEAELHTFATKAADRESRKRSLQERDARAYNHSRRVLLHHKSCKEDGFSKALEYISRQSSEKCKELSRKDAARMEKAVKKYNTRMPVEEHLKQDSSFQTGIDYYVNRFFDMFPTQQQR